MKKISVFASLFLLVLSSAIFAQSEKSAKELYNEGIENYKSKNFAGGVKLIEQAIEKANEEGYDFPPYYYFYAGDGHYKTENYAKAAEYIVKAEEAGYTKSKVYLKLAETYEELDDSEKQLQALKKGYTKYPTDYQLAQKIGLYFFNQAAIYQGNAKKLESQRDKCLAELELAKKELESAKPYLVSANDLVAKQIEKTSSDRKKQRFLKSKEKIEQYIAMADKAIKEIQEQTQN